MTATTFYRYCVGSHELLEALFCGIHTSHLCMLLAVALLLMAFLWHFQNISFLMVSVITWIMACHIKGQISRFKCKSITMKLAIPEFIFVPESIEMDSLEASYHIVYPKHAFNNLLSLRWSLTSKKNLIWYLLIYQNIAEILKWTKAFDTSEIHLQLIG